MSSPTPDMADTELTFRVGMALGRALAPRPPAIPALAPGQSTFSVWSEPDWLFGYRTLLTFELRERTSDVDPE